QRKNNKSCCQKNTARFSSSFVSSRFPAHPAVKEGGRILMPNAYHCGHVRNDRRGSPSVFYHFLQRYSTSVFIFCQISHFLQIFKCLHHIPIFFSAHKPVSSPFIGIYRF